MNDEQETSFQNKTRILGDLLYNYGKDEEFADFVEYNNLGLPLAYLLSEGIVQSTVIAEKLVNETWELFLAGLGIADDGFESLDEILGLDGQPIVWYNGHRKETMTTLDNKIAILKELQENKDDFELLETFIYVNDVALPLAWSVHYGYAILTTKGQDTIEQSFEMLLGDLGYESDEDFSSLFQMAEPDGEQTPQLLA